MRGGYKNTLVPSAFPSKGMPQVPCNKANPADARESLEERSHEAKENVGHSHPTRMLNFCSNHVRLLQHSKTTDLSAYLETQPRSVGLETESGFIFFLLLSPWGNGISSTLRLIPLHLVTSCFFVLLPAGSLILI